VETYRAGETFMLAP